MQAKILTLNFLGTGQHRERNYNLLTCFHKIMSSRDDDSFKVRLFDGVGSQPKEKNSPHETPGNYEYDHVNHVKKSLEKGKVSKILQRLHGLVLGDGAEDLVKEALLYIEQIKNDNGGKLPEVINLNGYSRGADICVRVANCLAQNPEYSSIKVNLFLIDPVPGPGRLDDYQSFNIPENVQECFIALMPHEYRPGFDAQHIRRYVVADPFNTLLKIRPYYGDHGAGMNVTRSSDTAHTGKLIHSELYEACLRNGSLDKDTPIPTYYIKNESGKYDEVIASRLTSKQKLEDYLGMKENEKKYDKGLAINKRAINKHMDDYVLGSSLFINQEHRELFKKYYPAIFTWFFEKNFGGKCEVDVMKELDLLENQHPGFFNLISDEFKMIQKNPKTNLNADLVENHPTYPREFFERVEYIKTLPKPQGVFQDEESFDNKPLLKKNDELSFLLHSLRSLANYYHYRYSPKNLENNKIEQMVSCHNRRVNQQSETMA